jgi:small redox-active disulfide protein 2
MEIKVLGTGCAKCRKLYEEAQQAIEHLRLPVTLTKVEKLDEIMDYGVMLTPALVVDGEVKCSGRIAKAAEIVSWITTAAAKRE